MGCGGNVLWASETHSPCLLRRKDTHNVFGWETLNVKTTVACFWLNIATWFHSSRQHKRSNPVTFVCRKCFMVNVWDGWERELKQSSDKVMKHLQQPRLGLSSPMLSLTLSVSFNSHVRFFATLLPLSCLNYPLLCLLCSKMFSSSTLSSFFLIFLCTEHTLWIDREALLLCNIFILGVWLYLVCILYIYKISVSV